MMKLNSKVAKNMRGFSCHSPTATAVCMAMSVIVPRRPDATLSDRAMLINKKDYARILEARRASSVPSFKIRNGEMGNYNLPLSLHPRIKSSRMRDSLHCQGCAGKVKKHLSKSDVEKHLSKKHKILQEK